MLIFISSRWSSAATVVSSSATIQSQFIEAPIDNSCQGFLADLLKRFNRRLSHGRMSYGYRGMRGAFYLRAEPKLNSFFESNLTLLGYNFLYNIAWIVNELPPEFNDVGIINLAKEALKISQESWKLQNISPYKGVSAGWANDWGKDALSRFNFVIGAQLKPKVKWGKDKGFYNNTSADLELKIPAAEFTSRPSEDWVVGVQDKGMFFAQDNPNLDPSWRNHLKFVAASTEFIVNLLNSKEIDPKDTLQRKQIVTEYLKFIMELDKQYKILPQKAHQKIYINSDPW